ncbi:MAG TPA: hypothetical protein VF406_00120 [Thermodesulfobacteriota bacterium]
MSRGRPIEIPVRRAHLAVLLQIAIDNARQAAYGRYTREMIQRYADDLGPYRTDIRRAIGDGLNPSDEERGFEGTEREAWARLWRDLGGERRRRR